MSKMIFHVHSNHNSFSMEINNDSEEAVLVHLELISIFWNINNNSIEMIPMQMMNNEMRIKYEQFVEKYKNVNPQINRLKSALNKIQNNEYFFTSNKSDFSTKEILFIGNLINTYNASTDDEQRAKIFQEQTDRQNEVMGDLLSKYTNLVFDSEKRKSIGESDRQKRICRFCKNGMHTEVKVSFDKKAHAFSEALGNKALVLNEECDVCNDIFGSTIEDDFITYLDIYRIFYNVKGKNGIPKLKYKNGGMVASVDGQMIVQSQNIDLDEQTGNLNVFLESHKTIKEVNIYKTLCKYVLGTINKEELVHLEDTVNWIKSEGDEYIPLPKVGILLSHEMFVETPVLAVYIRKDDNGKSPHIVGEFKFKSLVFAFVVPFSEKDEVDFIDEMDYESFWKTFKHYSAVPTWSFQDFSSVKANKYQFNINIQQAKEVES